MDVISPFKIKLRLEWRQEFNIWIFPLLTEQIKLLKWHKLLSISLTVDKKLPFVFFKSSLWVKSTFWIPVWFMSLWMAYRDSHYFFTNQMVFLLIGCYHRGERDVPYSISLVINLTIEVWVLLFVLWVMCNGYLLIHFIYCYMGNDVKER